MTDNQQQQPPPPAQPEQAPAENHPVNPGEAVPGPAPREPNRRVETIVKEWVARRRWVVIGALALALTLVGGCLWLRSGPDAPAAAAEPPPITAPESELPFEERLQQARTEWELALPPTPDVDALVSERLVNELALRAMDSAPSPAQVPGKLEAYNEYRYYHFLEEYKMCLGAQPAGGVAIAEPTPEAEAVEETDTVSTDTEVETAGAEEGTGAGEPPTPEPTPEPVPEPTQVPTPVLEMRPELDLEIETLQALPEAVTALLDMYDTGQCLERDDYAVYRGRGTWLRRWR